MGSPPNKFQEVWTRKCVDYIGNRLLIAYIDYFFREHSLSCRSLNITNRPLLC